MAKKTTGRFTMASVAALPTPEPAERNTLYWDTDVRGFGVRVFYTGRRAFVYQFRFAGRTGRLRIGFFPDINVDTARKLAKQAAGQLARGQRPSLRAEGNTRAHTVGELFPSFLEDRGAKLKPRTITEYTRQWDKVLTPAFGRKLAAEVNEGQVASWHSGMRGTPMLANRALDLLSGFFAWAEKRGHRPRHSNPCTDVDRYEESSRSRSLTREEYRSLGEAMERALTTGIRPAPKLQKHSTKEKTKNRRPKLADQPKLANPVIVASLRFLALSGWREQEALTLRWDAVDFDRGTATLSDTKTGRSVRPLGDAALDVLRQQERKPENPYVFRGLKPGLPLVEVKYTWTSIRHAAGLSDMRLHDLRHSFTTVASDELGIHDRFIAGLIGHKLAGTTARYGEVRDATLRTKADDVSRTIDGYMKTGATAHTVN